MNADESRMNTDKEQTIQSKSGQPLQRYFPDVVAALRKVKLSGSWSERPRRVGGEVAREMSEREASPRAIIDCAARCATPAAAGNSKREART